MHDLTRTQCRWDTELPPTTLRMGRRSRWDNPWQVVVRERFFTKKPVWCVERYGKYQPFQSRDEAVKYAVKRHWLWIWHQQAPLRDEFCTIIRERGIHQLACQCPLDQPCHADNWIEVWQQEGRGDD